jgi:hypothetical protein
MGTKNSKPVLDSGKPRGPRPVPYRAGGPQGELSDRKNALMNTGTTGYVPGHGGTGHGSSAQAGHVQEASLTSSGDDELEAGRRPMPREIPVHSQTTHFGNITRYLDGHSEIHRERPGLVELMNHPSTPDDMRGDIADEIVHRDAVHNHRYW